VRHSRPIRPAFSLVELLVVIGIVAVLIGLLVPVLSRARQASRSAACLANLHTWGQAYQMYVSANHGRTIPEQTNDDTTPRWWEALSPYNDDVPGSLLCPEAREPRYGSKQRSGTARHAWRQKTYDTPKPQRTVRGDWVGSYGFNVWVYDPGDPGNPGEMRPHYIRFPLKESDRVPLLGDCCDAWTAASPPTASTATAWRSTSCSWTATPRGWRWRTCGH
jgi:prepilin-type N-terminal cleavage/methylation domain-containing protein